MEQENLQNRHFPFGELKNREIQYIFGLSERQIATPFAIRHHSELEKYNGLFHYEFIAVNNLIQLCSYMTKDEQAMVAQSALLSLFAHRNTYRNTGEPFSLHPLYIANFLVKKFHVRPEIVAASLLHDVIEDESDTLKKDLQEENIEKIITETASKEVYPIVEGLTKLRSGKTAFDNEINRLHTIKSALLSDPRVLIIKLVDRIHNLATIQGKDELKRKKIIQETMEIYIPLAKVAGLYDIAHILGELCLIKTSEKVKAWYRNLKREQNNYLLNSKTTSLENELTDYFDGMKKFIEGGIQVKAYIPGSLDIARKGEKHLHIAIDLLDFYSFSNSWQEEALRIPHFLSISKMYEVNPYDLVESIDDFTIKNSLQLTDSFKFQARRISDNLLVQFAVYPYDLHLMEQTPFTDLPQIHYYHNEDDQKLKIALAKNKFVRIHSQLTKFLGEKQLVDSSNIVMKRFEPRTFNSISFVLRTKEGRLLIGIDAGASALDFAKSAYPYQWKTIQEIKVNGIPVPQKTLLEQYQIVEFIFDPDGKEHVDASWISAFRIDDEGKKKKKNEIRERGKKGERETIQNIRNYCHKFFSEKIGRELLIKLDTIEIFLEKWGFSSVDNFLLKVVLEEVDKEILNKATKLLQRINNKVIIVEICFSENESQQTHAVLDVVGDTNLLKIVGLSASEIGSRIELYFHPEDKEKAEKIRKLFNGNSRLLRNT